ncbi:cation transporter dimerization domain-containing protein [Amycolatopsis sp. NPDC023774]|uniref:cation transporter dimerization domain-containing protein n=1 Tax=Amycolatopsis sp. NPDC023774 TaxID=3155015 RepID=UPI00340627B0
MAILSVLCGAAKEVFSRMLDAIDPVLLDARRTDPRRPAPPGVRGGATIRLRWVGHTLIAESELDVEPTLPLLQTHAIAHDAEHRLSGKPSPTGPSFGHPRPCPGRRAAGPSPPGDTCPRA